MGLEIRRARLDDVQKMPRVSPWHAKDAAQKTVVATAVGFSMQNELVEHGKFAACPAGGTKQTHAATAAQRDVLWSPSKRSRNPTLT
jgi:hypothetical protein